jgi:hypothetical protein
MVGHIVNKWHSVIRCLIWGRFFVQNDHRTFVVHFVPLPGRPRSTDPLDPIWSIDD